MVLNDVETLIDYIGYPSDETSEGELNEILQQANHDMQNGVGKHFVEDKRVRVLSNSDGELVNEFNLKFGPITEINRVLLNEYEQVSEDKYTLDKSNGTITFDQQFVDEQLFKGQIIRFEYTPSMFKDIELWHAVKIAKNQELIQLEDSEQTGLHDNALKRAKRLENSVNRRASPGNATDGDIRRGTK